MLAFVNTRPSLLVHLHFPPFGKWTAENPTPKFLYGLVTFWRLRNVCKKYAEFSRKRQIVCSANIQNVLFTGNVLTCAHRFGGRVSQSLVHYIM
jgi:hypothetical protein